GNPAGCSGSSGTLTTDQRGVHRPIGSACDIGAYERAPCGDVNGDGLVNVTDVFFLINFLFVGGQLPPGLANVDGNATTDVNDVFSVINSLFAGGPAPNCPGT
ncbi:MAG TPA: choice-of-anchor Q domain-containing protein, partial [Thermoanaerobaculia bacterium]|nr:choice-of-anchor Q domain-containing protein [Thermoanaerobaculia bacterium]